MIDVSMQPYWRTDTAMLLNASVLEGLRALPDGSVHCVVTSPPYLGLRNYGTEPVAWGGEPKCVHNWHEETHYRYSPVRTGAEGIGFRDAGVTRKQHSSTDSRCVWCGAWQGQLGLEPLHDCLAWARSEPPCPLCYVCHMRTIFRELWRVLRSDGTVWLNIADSYNGSGGSGGDYRRGGLREGQSGYPGRHFPHLKPKNLTGIPWRTALALQADGWTLRSDIIWHKPNPMPQSVTDRPTSSYEHLFLLAKSPRYYYDQTAIGEPSVRHGDIQVLGGRKGRSFRPPPGDPAFRGGTPQWGKTLVTPPRRNRRDVWTITTKPYRGAHFATFPPDLVEPCILAGTSERGCCSKCGAPWQRVLEKGRPLDDWRKISGAGASGGYEGKALKDYAGQRVQEPGAVKKRILSGMVERRTSGWHPTCNCDSKDTADADGSCDPCGTPAMSPTAEYRGKWSRAERQSAARQMLSSARARRKAGQPHDNPFPARKTKSWVRSCSCSDGGPVPCTVLDPFAGSGTTGAVALQHGRNFIGIELNPSYCALAVERIGKAEKPESKLPACSSNCHPAGAPHDLKSDGVDGATLTRGREGEP